MVDTGTVAQKCAAMSGYFGGGPKGIGVDDLSRDVPPLGRRGKGAPPPRPRHRPGTYGPGDSSGRRYTLRSRNRRLGLSLIHISEPTRLGMISYAVFCLKKKKK